MEARRSCVCKYVCNILPIAIEVYKIQRIRALYMYPWEQEKASSRVQAADPWSRKACFSWKCIYLSVD